MPPIHARVVTIITTFEAREVVLKKFTDLGVHGFSATHVEGVGVHGEKRSGLFGVQNVEFVLVVSETLSARLLTWVEDHLLPNHPGVAYSTVAIAVAARPID